MYDIVELHHVIFSISFATFSGADKLWKSMHERVAAFVNANEGKATILRPYSKMYPWNAVKKLYNLGKSKLITA